MRKVYLDDLPHRGSLIDWENSIGYKVNFEYDNIKGQIEIIKYNSNKQQLLVEYNNEQINIKTYSLTKCRLSHLLKIYSKYHDYSIGDNVSTNTGIIKILKLIWVTNNKYLQKGYEYECLTCHTINTTSEGALDKKSGCPVCSGKQIKVGFNDMWTTNLELARLLADPEDGYKYTQHSGQRVDWKCPSCNNIIENRLISQICNDGLSCPKCSDGFSYPEKIMYNVFDQIINNFKYHQSFNWLKNKIYDFYLIDLNTIIEVHGLQHYEENGFKYHGGRTLQEEQENDRLKENLAKQNNITNYIIIDARYSELEYIKNSIMNSKLAELFDLSNIDWLKCHEFACGSMVKVACDLWNNGIKNSTEIGKILKINRSTARRYLKKGALLDWCNYNPEEATKMSSSKSGKKNKKQVLCITKNIIFDSLTDASNYFNIDVSNISMACKGKIKTVAGCQREYLN